MSKQLKMETEFKGIFSKLMIGSRSEFKEAKKMIERFWHADSDTFRKAAPIALEYIARFDEIKKPENQAAFASGLSYIFLAIADEHFDVLKNFTLKLLQYPNGHVREAMRHTAEWLYISVSGRVDPFVYPAGKELTDKQKIVQHEARKQYAELVKEVEVLLNEFDEDDADVEYIDEMKPSVEKSLQQFWGRLTDDREYRKLVEQARPIPMEIYMKRREIEHELMELIKKTKNDFDMDIDDVRDIIYDEEGNKDFQQLITMFDRGGDVSELSDILELMTDVWNYFPHRSLDGLSPHEKLMEYKNEQKK